MLSYMCIYFIKSTEKYKCVFMFPNTTHKYLNCFFKNVILCYRFHRSYYLTDHLKTHTGLKPHTCHICGKTTSSKSNHNKHVRTHHARESVNTEG